MCIIIIVTFYVVKPKSVLIITIRINNKLYNICVMISGIQINIKNESITLLYNMNPWYFINCKIKECLLVY